MNLSSYGKSLGDVIAKVPDAVSKGFYFWRSSQKEILLVRSYFLFLGEKGLCAEKWNCSHEREKIPPPLLAPRRRQRMKPHVCLSTLVCALCPGDFQTTTPPFPVICLAHLQRAETMPSPPKRTRTCGQKVSLPCSIILPSPLRCGKKRQSVD